MDSDEPADELATFIKGKYHKYIDNDIFVFQYGEKNEKVSEFEDRLPMDIIRDSIIDSFQRENIKPPNDNSIEKLIKSKLSFSKYIDEIFPEDSKTKLKTHFKEILNNKLTTQLNEIKKNGFKEIFEKYFEWANGVVAFIKKPINNVDNERLNKKS